MPEGLSTTDVGKEIAAFQPHGDHASRGSDWVISMIEAALLAIVAVLAAWSGFAAAKWNTDSSLTLATAATTRTEANRSNLTAQELRNFDSSTFNTWFTAFVAGEPSDADVAVRRFRPDFRVAFDAWIATDPFTNADAPPGPSNMPEYRQPDAERAAELDANADELFAEGARAGRISDNYVRHTVVLASVLFLVGISGHFRFATVRYALVIFGSAILVVAIALLVTTPRPP